MAELMELFKSSKGRYPKGNVQDELRQWAADEITTLRQQLAKSEARVAELEGQFHVKQLASLMRGLEVKPGFGSMPPEGFYALGRAITDQAKAATEPAILRKQAEAVKNYSAALGMWLKELPGKPCASFVEGVVSSAEQADRYAQRLRQQADEAERAGGEK